MTGQGVPIGRRRGYNVRVLLARGGWQAERIVGMSGRVFDLILVEQPESSPRSPRRRWRTRCSRAAGDYDGAEGDRAHLGDTIAVAWNGSTETR